MSYQLPTQFLVPGQPVNVQLLHPQLVQALKISNKSPYDIQYADFGVQGSDWIVAGTEYMLYGSVQNQGDIYLLAVNTTNISPANPGAVLITQFQIGEEIPKGSWPVSIPFQTVNTNSSVTTAQSIDNEGNVAGTSIIKSVVAGDGTNASVSLTNDAQFTLGDALHAALLAITGNLTINNPEQINPTPVHIVGGTSGTADMYQILSGAFKLVYVNFITLECSANQDMAIPTPFTSFVCAISFNLGNGQPLELLSGGVAQTESVITSIASTGGASTNVTQFFGNSIFDVNHAVDTLRVLGGNLGHTNGGLLLFGT